MIFANKVIVGAGPIGSVPLLLRSKRYLQNISPALGKYVSNNGDINFVLKHLIITLITMGLSQLQVAVLSPTDIGINIKTIHPWNDSNSSCCWSKY